MKKVIIGVSILAVCAVALVTFLSRPSLFELGSKAELQGDYAAALENYIKALSEITGEYAYPDKNNTPAISGDEWIKRVEQYLAWTSFSQPFYNSDYDKTLESIRQCMTRVEVVNFITGQKPKSLTPDSLEKEWREAFVRVDMDEEKAHEALVSRAFSDTLSMLCIRAMTGYIYYGQLLDIKTGKRTRFTLYPSSNIYLLVKPRDYLLFCSSEVQFTEGVKTKSWRSPQTVIPLSGQQTASIHSISLKTQVHRSE